MKIEIYTDGACSGNPGPGGWALTMIDSDGEEMTSQYDWIKIVSTNNHAELIAIIKALNLVLDFINISHKTWNGLEKFRKCGIILYSDSQYAIRGINEWMPKWRENNWCNADNKIIKNQSHWINIDYLIEKINKKGIRMEFEYTPAHTGNKYNEQVDKLAKKAVKELKKLIKDGKKILPHSMLVDYEDNKK